VVLIMTAPPFRRILVLLELAEEQPTVDELDEFLTDADPDVRRTALTVLSESAEEWERPSEAFAAALCDPEPAVRGTAIELLRELREVLVPGEGFDAALRVAVGSGDPRVRAAAVGALWRHRRCGVAELSGWFADPDETVRCEIVAGFVSLDALDALEHAAGDAHPAVRLAVARGIGAVGDPRGVAALVALAGDGEVLVRAAALVAMAETGCSGPAAQLAIEALSDPAWQIRQAAAAALSSADPDFAAGPLITATGDENLDVRKAAVRALGPAVPGHPDVRAALEAACTDVDADVRAFARISLAQSQNVDT
jgi:HEAT repeat protein